LADKISGNILADASIVSLGGGGAPDFTSEVVYFAVAANGTTTWRTQKDGWVTGFFSTLNSNIGISIAVDVPSAANAPGTTQGAFSGHLWYPSSASGNSLQNISLGKVPFKANQLINVKSYTATAVSLWLFLSYPIA
jgi:hypothetical protein